MNTTSWLNYGSIAKSINEVAKGLIESGRNFSGCREWKSGNMYHLTSTDTNEQFVKNVEVFALCHNKGAISIMLVSEYQTYILKSGISNPRTVFNSKQGEPQDLVLQSNYSVSFINAVRTAYHESDDEGIHDRQREIITDIMSDYRSQSKQYTLLNGETEVCHWKRFFTAMLFNKTDSSKIDELDLDECNITNLDVDTITSFEKLLQDLDLVSKCVIVNKDNY